MHLQASDKPWSEQTYDRLVLVGNRETKRIESKGEGTQTIDVGIGNVGVYFHA